MTENVLVFLDCIVNRDQRTLRVQGELKALEPKAFDVLIYLVQHRDRVVRQDELLIQIWKTRFLSESVVARAVMKVRRALGHTNDKPMIETMHRVGYRFVCELETPEPALDARSGRSLASNRHDSGDGNPSGATDFADTDEFVREALTRFNLALAQRRFDSALRYIDVCLFEQEAIADLGADQVVRMAAAKDGSTPDRAAAALDSARRAGDLLTQAKILCAWASYHDAISEPSAAHSLAQESLQCAERVRRNRSQTTWTHTPFAGEEAAVYGLGAVRTDRSRIAPLPTSSIFAAAA